MVLIVRFMACVLVIEAVLGVGVIGCCAVGIWREIGKIDRLRQQANGR